jgi:hypothetical protein
LSCGLATAVFAAEPCSVAGIDARSGWGQLDLHETSIAGTKVYCERGLEPNLPAFERELEKFLAAKDSLASVLGKRDQIIADINRIIGATNVDAARQSEVLAKVASPWFTGLRPVFYVVKVATIKSFLRAGGQLPHFSYDRQRDMVLYSPRIRLVEGEELPELFECCVPIGPSKEFAYYASAGLGIFQRFLGSGMVGAAIHEVTELTLIQRIRPTDPYWRWFDDGFANAITYTLTEKYLGEEAAREFAARNDASRYAHLERELNLRYWMIANFFVDVTPMPVEAEADVEYARYAYATAEAQGLLERHGTDCVAKILDAVDKRDSRGGGDLLEAIHEVTGEDVKERLSRYQTFETRAEGIAKYERAYQQATQEENYEQMFLNVLRLMEVRGDVFSEDHLLSFRNAAWILFKLGHEEAGDEVMRNAIDLYSTSSAVDGRAAALERFILYALDCDNPRKVDGAAEELLQTHPEHVSSLVVKMLVSFENGELAAARRIAGQVLEFAKEESDAHKLASKILAADPNQVPGL